MILEITTTPRLLTIDKNYEYTVVNYSVSASIGIDYVNTIVATIAEGQAAHLIQGMFLNIIFDKDNIYLVASATALVGIYKRRATGGL